MKLVWFLVLANTQIKIHVLFMYPFVKIKKKTVKHRQLDVLPSETCRGETWTSWSAFSLPQTQSCKQTDTHKAHNEILIAHTLITNINIQRHHQIFYQKKKNHRCLMNRLSLHKHNCKDMNWDSLSTCYTVAFHTIFWLAFMLRHAKGSSPMVAGILIWGEAIKSLYLIPVDWCR